MNHGTCPEGMECACCFDDIEGGTDGNYVEYRTGEGEDHRYSMHPTHSVIDYRNIRYRPLPSPISKVHLLYNEEDIAVDRYIF